MLVRDHKEAMSDMVGVVLMRMRRMLTGVWMFVVDVWWEREDVDQEAEWVGSK